jgi:hypothetical protein
MGPGFAGGRNSPIKKVFSYGIILLIIGAMQRPLPLILISYVAGVV